jgi:hypothetical protein
MYSRAGAVVVAVSEIAQSVASLRPTAEAAAETHRQIGRELEQIRESFVAKRMMRLDPAEVEVRRRRVTALQTQLEGLMARCREGNASAGLRAELAALLGEVEQSRAQLEPWLEESYASFINETYALLEQVDQSLAVRGSAAEHAGAVAAKLTDLTAMRSRAAERQTLDAQRQYVAQALHAVCQDMGFSAHTLPAGGPLEDLLIEVDTHAYGTIRFQLQLEGTIRSQSEMIEASCAGNFARIEEGLRALGVISGFRYEGDQRPVRIEKGAKPHPDSDATVQTRRGAG